MTQSPWVTIFAGVVGAVIALVSPFIAGWTNRRGAVRQAQREVASQIVDLLSAPGSLPSVFCGPESPARRRLLGLGLRLQDEAARNACTELVVTADGRDVSEDDLFHAWNHALHEVSRISRG